MNAKNRQSPAATCPTSRTGNESTPEADTSGVFLFTARFHLQTFHTNSLKGAYWTWMIQRHHRHDSLHHKTCSIGTCKNHTIRRRLLRALNQSASRP